MWEGNGSEEGIEDWSRNGGLGRQGDRSSSDRTVRERGNRVVVWAGLIREGV